jgi:hypothetical protein
MQTLGLGGTFRGHEGMLEAFGKLTEAWETWQLELAYLLDLGDRLLVLGFNRSRARESGLQLDEEYAQLVTLPEGVITHFRAFFSWEEALRAADLDPARIALAFPCKDERYRSHGEGAVCSNARVQAITFVSERAVGPGRSISQAR